MQTSEAPEPEVDVPAEHVHVEAPGPLVLPDGQDVQDAAPAALKEPGMQPTAKSKMGRRRACIRQQPAQITVNGRFIHGRGDPLEQEPPFEKVPAVHSTMATTVRACAKVNLVHTHAEVVLAAARRRVVRAYGCRRGRRQSRRC